MIGMLAVGLWIFVFAGALLILLLGARRIEDGLREREEEAREVAGDVPLTRRFLSFARSAAPGSAASEEAWLSELPAYLEAEQMAADEFVLQPSLELLYRESRGGNPR
jgi:hypothetical protein